MRRSGCLGNQAHLTKAIHFSDCWPKVISYHLSNLTCRIHYRRPYIVLAERARGSVEHEMVILAQALTIKEGNFDLKR